MDCDFLDAAQRHWDDAELLLTQDRLATADHLLGISAECALKAVMVALGMGLNARGAPKAREHMVHIDGLWAAFQSFAQGRMGARYIEPLEPGHPFGDWSPGQRYWNRSRFTDSRVDQHWSACEASLRTLGRCLLDGVL